MKRSEMLDLMGEIDEAYIEDAARHLENSPRRILQQWARPAGAAAVAGIMGFSIFLIYGVIRDGIAQQNPDGYSNSTAYAPLTEITEATLPPDIYEVLPDTTVSSAAETTVTETTATETAAPTGNPPEDSVSYEMPCGDLVQEVGSRFTVNWLAQSGMLAMTVERVQCYDTLEDAGLTYDDMSLQFRDAYIDLLSNPEGNEDEYDEPYSGSNAIAEQLQAIYEDYRFVKATVKIENLNAVSWTRSYNNITLPDGTIDANFATDYDFEIRSMYFGVIGNPDYPREKAATECWKTNVQYFSLSGQTYPKDDSIRSEWLYLPPGESVTCEVGAFLPRTYGTYSIRLLYGSDLHYDDGEDLLPYYYFGSYSMANPHIMLGLAEE